MSQYTPKRIGRGTLLQAGIPKRAIPDNAGQAQGLLMRGVVVATYVPDNPDHPKVSTAEPVAVYCDVLCYGSTPGYRHVLIPTALVLQPKAGIQGGSIWIPRATTLDITGREWTPDQGTSPADMDGDHVLVGFIDQNLNSPVILGGVPHPANDTGNENQDLGHRMKLKQVDGQPDFWKHHGTYYGVTPAGDFVVDTTRAHTGDLESDGKEPDPPEDGSTGNYKVRLPAGSTLTVDVDGGATINLSNSAGDTLMTVGDGAVSVAIADHLETLWGQLKTQADLFDAHVHSTGVGPSGPPTPLLLCPSWASNIKSTKVKIPDG